MATSVHPGPDLDRQPVRRGEPVWDLASLYPNQGEWTEDDYLSLNTNRLIEFSDGFLEVLPVPTAFHQLIATYLFDALRDFLVSIGMDKKRVFMAPLRVRLWADKFREPDVCYLKLENLPDVHRPAVCAALVMEVVSGTSEDRHRDLVTKREEYARARVQEYWIVDPQEQCIIVLTLAGDHYHEHGTFRPGQVATSVLFPGFQVDVVQVLSADEGLTE